MRRNDIHHRIMLCSIGFLSTVVCLIIAFFTAYFERYIGNFIFPIYLTCGFTLFITIHILVERINKKIKRSPFLPLLASIVLSLILFFSDTFEVLGNITYNNGYHSIGGWISLNFQALYFLFFVLLSNIVLLAVGIFCFIRNRKQNNKA